jgi:Cdc6-like AAA superfamily ATPase
MQQQQQPQRQATVKDVEKLWPCRRLQIKLLNAILLQAASSSNNHNNSSSDNRSDTSSSIREMVPIFVHGPPGTGKSGIVRDLLTLHKAANVGWVNCDTCSSTTDALDCALRQILGRNNITTTTTSTGSNVNEAPVSERGAANSGVGAADDIDGFDEDAIEAMRQAPSRGKNSNQNIAKQQQQPSSNDNAKRIDAGNPASAFARALRLKFGNASNANGGRRTAYLILDRADRLMSLSQPLLTQLLLLPRAANLRLRVIVISTRPLLIMSQINMIERSSGSISELVHPIRIHFNAYEMTELKQLLRQAGNIRKSIMNDGGSNSNNAEKSSRNSSSSSSSSSSSRGGNNDTVVALSNDIISTEEKNQIYNSMAEHLMNILQSSTRDICEISRLGRMLFPLYINAYARGTDVQKKEKGAYLFKETRESHKRLLRVSIVGSC